MSGITLYRKRFIPAENIELKDDQILLLTDNLIVTRWTALKPRKDICGGISAYFIPDGIKVSKIFDHSNQLVHWYCDIIHTNISKNSIIFEDLLIDVIIEKNGFVRVVDTKEAADALREHLITQQQLCKALDSLDLLLSKIYSGNFYQYTDIIQSFE